MVLKFVTMGLSVGLLGGLFGVGGGILMIPILTLFVGLTQREAQGVSLAVMVPMALFSFLRYRQMGLVHLDMKIIAIIAAGAVVGGSLGATLAGTLSNKTLQVGFGLFIVILGLFLIQRGIRAA